ncbi:MAG: PEP-CTERM sorting domain-containing protein [Thermoguttaceae bacterium]
MKLVTRSMLAGLMVWGALTGLVHAEPITLVEKSLTDLLGAGFTTAGTLLNSNMSSGNLHSEVLSQAFTNGGLYVYLYQVDNTGVAGNSSAELFTLGEFAGSLNAGDIGYLSGSIPTGFTSGDQVPESEAYVDELAGGLDISFYYTKRSGYEIAPGEVSRVMFLRSDYAPGQVVGSVIDHDAASGLVVGAVPEPTTMAMLVCGGLTALVCVVRRSRRSAMVNG